MLTVSTVSSDVMKVEMKERIEEKELIVHKIAFDAKAARQIVERDKTKFFAKLNLFKPKQEDIECESIQLFYDPFIVAKANYLIDYYRKKAYTIKIQEDVKEVIAFGQMLKPEAVAEGILRRPYKAISFDVQERVTHRVAAHMALNRTGREINPTRLPAGPTELNPEETLERNKEKARDLKISTDTILDKIRRRTIARPRDVARITQEKFEVTEYALAYTPIYEARCRRLRTGETKILPISGVSGKLVQL